MSSNHNRDLESEDGPLWTGRNMMRNDIEPHRGELLKLMGFTSVILGLLSGFLIVPAVVGFPLGLLTWLWAGQDLAKMRAGHLDPNGWSVTQEARYAGGAGIHVNCLCPFTMPLVFFILYKT